MLKGLETKKKYIEIPEEILFDEQASIYKKILWWVCFKFPDASDESIVNICKKVINGILEGSVVVKAK